MLFQKEGINHCDIVHTVEQASIEESQRSQISFCEERVSVLFMTVQKQNTKYASVIL